MPQLSEEEYKEFKQIQQSKRNEQWIMVGFGVTFALVLFGMGAIFLIEAAEHVQPESIESFREPGIFLIAGGLVVLLGTLWKWRSLAK